MSARALIGAGDNMNLRDHRFTSSHGAGFVQDDSIDSRERNCILLPAIKNQTVVLQACIRPATLND